MGKNIFLKISLIWNNTILKEEALIKPKKVTIGADTNNVSFAIESDNVNLDKSFELLMPTNSGRYMLSVLETMEGNVKYSDREYTLDEFRKEKCVKIGEIYQVEIEPFNTNSYFVKGDIDIDDKTFSLNFVTAKALSLKGMLTLDRDFLKYLILVAILHAVLVLFVGSFQTYGEELTFATLPDRFVTMIINEPKDSKSEPEKDRVGKRAEDVAKAMSGKSGRAGVKDKPKYLKTKIPKGKAKLIRSSLKNSGVFSVIKGNSFSDIISEDSAVASRLLASNFNSQTGDDYVAGIGSGTGIRGAGTGGGGSSGYGRIGGTGAIDTGNGRGIKVSLIKKREERKIKYIVSTKGKASYSGFCKRSDIQRVVNHKSRAIRYCYTQALKSYRKLKGKVKIMWIIGLDGGVEKVSVIEDSVKSNRMNGCLKRQINRWQFSKPKGGKCRIMYPFLFSTTQ